MAIGIHPGLRVTIVEGNGLSHAIAQTHTLCQEALHALVRTECSPFLIPQTVQQANSSGVKAERGSYWTILFSISK